MVKKRKQKNNDLIKNNILPMAASGAVLNTALNAWGARFTGMYKARPLRSTVIGILSGIPIGMLTHYIGQKL